VRNKNELRKKSYKFISNAFHRQKILLVPLLSGIIFSFWFCLKGITGDMEPWISSNIDYYYWTFMADYWLGNAYPMVNWLNIWPAMLQDFDAFGSDIVYAFFACASGKSPLMASPWYFISLYSILSTMIYLLVRASFKLNCVLSFTISILLIWSNFFIYLGIYGFLPQLLALLCYLNLFYIVIAAINDNRSNYFFKLLFPLLLLYTSYQAAYLIFVFMIFISITINMLVKYREIIFKKSKKLIILLKKTFIPFFIAILMSFVLVPEMLKSFITRSLFSVNQTDGYSLTLLDPELFYGLPILNDSLDLRQSDASFFSYGLFIAVILLLFIFYKLTLKNIKTAGKNSKISSISYQEQLQNLKVFLILFFLSIAIYLSAFFLKGDIYQVWKLGSYTILPLAFLPLTLFILVIGNICRARSIFIFLVFGLIILLIPKLLSSYSAYMAEKKLPPELRSIYPIIYRIDTSVKNFLLKNKIIFDFNFRNGNMLAALISGHLKGKVYITKPILLMTHNNDYLSYFDKDSVLLTNMQYDGLYGGSFIGAAFPFQVFSYDYATISEMGAVSYMNVDTYTGTVISKDVAMKFLVPNKLLGKDIKVKVLINTNTASDAGCLNTLAYLDNEENFQLTELRADNFEYFIPSASIKDGQAVLVISFPKYGEISPEPGKVTRQCSYQIQKVELTE
jgi:hypothetical protein